MLHILLNSTFVPDYSFVVSSQTAGAKMRYDRVPIHDVIRTSMSSLPADKQQVLAEFRRRVEEEGILHDGDTIGSDDDTLL
jgi:hypothetical protein